jgi:hypothetical protein
VRLGRCSLRIRESWRRPGLTLTGPRLGPTGLSLIWTSLTGLRRARIAGASLGRASLRLRRSGLILTLTLTRLRLHLTGLRLTWPGWANLRRASMAGCSVRLRRNLSLTRLGLTWPTWAGLRRPSVAASHLRRAVLGRARAVGSALRRGGLSLVGPGLG